MEELKDYSGPFVRGLRYQDFTKDQMAKLICEFGRLYELIDGLWLTNATKEFGIDKAWEIEQKVWKDVVRHVLGGVRKVANIQGNDVSTALKTIQLDPCFTPGLYEYDLYFKSENDALMTIYRCPSLLYFERAYPNMVAPLCQVLEVKAFDDYAKHFNPEMTAKPIFLPPRKSKDQSPVCQWEFKLPDKKK